MKFYRQEARRILAGPKKMSTILVTRRSAREYARTEKILTGNQMLENRLQAHISTAPICGKAEDQSGYQGPNSESAGERSTGIFFDGGQTTEVCIELPKKLRLAV